MTLFCEICGLLLVICGIAGLIGLVMGRLLLPVILPLRAVVEGSSAGQGLEQTVRALLWLRKRGLWRGAVIIENRGLDGEGLLLARMLARQDGVEFKDAELT